MAEGLPWEVWLVMALRELYPAEWADLTELLMRLHDDNLLSTAEVRRYSEIVKALTAMDEDERAEVTEAMKIIERRKRIRLVSSQDTPAKP